MRTRISRHQFLSTGAAVTLAAPIAAQQANGGASSPNPGAGTWVRDPISTLPALLSGPQGAGAGKVGMTTEQWLRVAN